MRKVIFEVYLPILRWPKPIYMRTLFSLAFSIKITWRTISYIMAAAYAKRATFGLSFQNAVNKITKKSMRICLTVLKIVL